MTTNQDLHEQVAAYALDALDGDERRAFETHLAGCASSGKIASTGHSGSHAPQSMHSSGLI